MYREFVLQIYFGLFLKRILHVDQNLVFDATLCFDRNDLGDPIVMVPARRTLEKIERCGTADEPYFVCVEDMQLLYRNRRLSR